MQRTPVELRHEVMIKLLRLGPESTSRLVQITGWGEDAVQKVLLELVVANQVKCSSYRKLYSLREIETDSGS